MSGTDDIVFERRGRLGHIRLNRPAALNAVTEEMCGALHRQLKAWKTDTQIKAVVIRGTGDKAFCAGGDVVRLYEDGKDGGSYPKKFYKTEYICNTYIKRFPKPYIALIDGIVMGGGVGVSIHGALRVVTEKTTFAMPETGIGLFPDVGGTYFLPRVPGLFGYYLGLTGRRLKAADCLALGLADIFVPRDKLDAVEAALAERGESDAAQVKGIIQSFAGDAGPAPIMAERANIDKHFGFDTVEQILASLDAAGDDWAKSNAETLRPKSPLSMKIALRQMREGSKLEFEDAMRLEWRLANRFAADHDFYEGVRALLVDKDLKPKWKPATLADTSAAKVDSYFAPLPDGDLQFDNQ